MNCTNLDDRIIAAIEAFCALVGFSKEELIATTPSPLPIPMTTASPERPISATPVMSTECATSSVIRTRTDE
jgi:hypothetical protein